MTILEPTLYANGQLRFTRHGDRAGGTVLVHVPTGKQIDVCDAETTDLQEELEKVIAQHPDSEDVIDTLIDWFKPIPRRA